MSLPSSSCNPVDRVEQARQNCAPRLKDLAERAGLPHPVPQVYVRAFKEEKLLEVWGSDGKSEFKLIKSYPVAALSGSLGPKRKEGDGQVPEGFYRVDGFNPQSKFHLSLKLDYPNASDRILSDKTAPGSDIFVHGGAASIGCLAMTDPAIEEIYLMVLEARRQGQKVIRVDLFPFRPTSPRWSRARGSSHTALWTPLKAAYDLFQSGRQVPMFRVSRDGRYVVTAHTD